MSTVARRVVVHGRVQGVGYRFTMVGVASHAGVQGWVRNRRDGAVEVVVGGSPPAVEALVDRCRKGPPLSKVESIDISDAEVLDLGYRRPLENFSLLATE